MEAKESPPADSSKGGGLVWVISLGILVLLAFATLFVFKKMKKEKNEVIA